MSEETTGGVTEESVREALRMVVDPELHLDIVTLGLLKSVDLTTTPVDVKMLLTTPFCPYGPWLVQQVKETGARCHHCQLFLQGYMPADRFTTHSIWQVTYPLIYSI